MKRSDPELQNVGPDWMQYLEESGNLDSYDGMCDCYRCREIRKGYFSWKASKEKK